MEIQDIVSACRDRYNAVGDRFFSDEELFNLIYDAQCEMAIVCQPFENIYTTSTVIAQRDYDYPSKAIRIFRITYDGQRLEPIDFIEDDTITGNDENTDSTGTPRFYCKFNQTLFLRPAPDEVKTLKVYAIIEPTEITSVTDPLTVPSMYRSFLKDFVLSQMFAKDKNSGMTTYHEQRWQKHLDNVKRFEKKRKVGDAYPVVKDVDSLSIKDFGGLD